MAVERPEFSAARDTGQDDLAALQRKQKLDARMREQVKNRSIQTADARANKPDCSNVAGANSAATGVANRDGANTPETFTIDNKFDPKHSIKIDLKGVSLEQRSYVKEKLTKIFNDEQFQKSLVGRTLNVNFQDMKQIWNERGQQCSDVRAQTHVNKPGTNVPDQNMSITFNTKFMTMRNGKVEFDGKPFESVAVHEATHARFPNLSGDSSQGHDSPVGDYLFRTMTTKMIERVFPGDSQAIQDEQTQRQRAFERLHASGANANNVFGRIYEGSTEIRDDGSAGMEERVFNVVRGNTDAAIIQSMNDAKQNFKGKMQPGVDPHWGKQLPLYGNYAISYGGGIPEIDPKTHKPVYNYK
jgi:hypothetical protein